MEMNTQVITTKDLAGWLGKEEVERTLPNGSVTRQVVWTGSDLPELDKRLRELSANPVHYVLDGPAPAFISTAFAHGLHPQLVSLNDPRIGHVGVQRMRPDGDGEGPNLRWRTADTPEFTLVEYEIEGGVFDVKNLPQVTPPAVGDGKGVVVSGRGPNWLTTSVAMAYHGNARWVGLWQPGQGATVAISHDPNVSLGSVIPDSVVSHAREVAQQNTRATTEAMAGNPGQIADSLCAQTPSGEARVRTL